MRSRHPTMKRAGSVLVLTALMMVAMFIMIAFAVDIGYINVARSELQRTADSAAIAGAWELLDEGLLTRRASSDAILTDARNMADQYSRDNLVTGQGSALAQSDVTIGAMANPRDPQAAITTADAAHSNAIQVCVRRTSDQNGQVPLFFARIIGLNGESMQAQATAAFLNNFSGFQAPSNGQNLGILPFALDKQTWDALVNDGVGADGWKYDAETGHVTAGSDGVLEVNLFPQGTGSPGNRGTVDIGSSNNSTCDIARQILHGITEHDLSYLGGKLELNDQGRLMLNGDTGISAGVKDELAEIIGEPRIIPIFESVSGNGNNAEYVIVQFAGVRIVEVKLTGSMSSKRVMIQPCYVNALGGIPATNGQCSTYVHSPVWLVR